MILIIDTNLYSDRLLMIKHNIVFIFMFKRVIQLVNSSVVHTVRLILIIAHRHHTVIDILHTPFQIERIQNILEHEFQTFPLHDDHILYKPNIIISELFDHVFQLVHYLGILSTSFQVLWFFRILISSVFSCCLYFDHTTQLLIPQILVIIDYLEFPIKWLPS